MRDAFIAHTKLMIENGYDPEPIMCGMLWASATLGVDMHGSAWTADQLRYVESQLPKDGDTPAPKLPRGGLH